VTDAAREDAKRRSYAGALLHEGKLMVVV